jgi:hypothetical protein
MMVKYFIIQMLKEVLAAQPKIKRLNNKVIHHQLKI